MWPLTEAMKGDANPCWHHTHVCYIPLMTHLRQNTWYGTDTHHHHWFGWMQAHFINNRSMEVFRPLDGLADEIAARSPPLAEWREFVYCESLTGRIFGQVDHFKVRPRHVFSRANLPSGQTCMCNSTLVDHSWHRDSLLCRHRSNMGRSFRICHETK